MLMFTEKLWREQFARMGAFWLHDENPKRPHALLTSGKHSNGFFNGSKVIEQPIWLECAMHDLLDKITAEGSLPNANNLYVIGSALGACDLSYELGHILRCRRGFTEPVDVDGKKTMQLKRFEIPAGTNVLVVEDVMTTGDTTRKTIAELEARGAVVWPVLGVLVNRSGESMLDNRKVVAVIDHPMPMWTPEECPLCKAGSVATRPKTGWKQLTAEY